MRFKAQTWDFPIDLDDHGWSSGEGESPPVLPPLPAQDKLYPSLPDIGALPTPPPLPPKGDEYSAWTTATLRKQQTSFESLRAKLRAPLAKTSITSIETYPKTPRKRVYDDPPEVEESPMEPLPDSPRTSASGRSVETPRTGITPQFSRISVERPPTAPLPVKLPKIASKPTATWTLHSPLNALPAESAYLELVPRNPYQAYLNNNVSFYVQWELERQLLLAGLSWEDVNFEDFETLRGDAVAAMPTIPSVVKKVWRRGSSQADLLNTPGIQMRTLIEIDQEERSIAAQDLLGVQNDSRDWPYGGKLLLVATLEYSTNPGFPPNVPDSLGSNPFAPVWPFNVHLQPVEMPGRSNRLARRFGSRRLLYLRFGTVPRQQRDLVFGLFRGHGLVLFGRVFRVLYIATDSDTAIAVQVDEDAPGAPPLKEPKVFSFLQLLGSYNDIRAKPTQAMAKWAARLQLVMSDSVPVARIERHKIKVIPDVVCLTATNPSDPAASEILTDGCGLISSRLAQAIHHHPFFADLRWPPCSVQMRLGGSKGVLSLMSREQEEEYEADVVLRPSMIKSKSAAGFANDPSVLTLDVLKVDGLKVGCNLSSEAIIIMEDNGVPTDVLISKVELEFEKIKEMLLPSPHPYETQDDVRQRLLHAVYTMGGVGSEREKRRCRQLGKSTKVAGLSLESTPLEDSSEEDISVAEKIYRCLQSGFLPNPTDSVWLSNKLKFLVKSVTDRAVSDFKLPIEQSLSALIVPDTLGVLKPNEIFISPSSANLVNPRTLRPMSCLEGDVLIFRSPCKLPTDVRKMKAVYHSALKHLQDCIVMSADSSMCSSSPASLLAGGDYDGDTATVIWDDDLVKPFTNAPEPDLDEKKFQEENFNKEVVAVIDFLQAVRGNSRGKDEEARMAINLQHFLLGGIMDQQLTGRYSAMHDNAVYTLGPSHPATVRLANMFCLVLDSRKSGLTVKPDVLKADLRRYGSHEVFWRKFKKGQVNEGYNVTYAKRSSEMGEFVMDKLYSAATKAQLKVLSAYTVREAPEEFSRLLDDYTFFKESIEDEETNLHLSTLIKHVDTCVDLLPLVYFSGEDLGEAYTKRQKNGRFYKRQAWSPEDELNESPIASSPAVPASLSSSRSSSSKPTSAEVLRRMKALQQLWTSLPKPSKVPRLAALGSSRLEELKVLCCIDVCVRSRRPVKLPFELDLNTLCKLKAQSIGSTVTIVEDFERDLRPKRFRRG